MPEQFLCICMLCKEKNSNGVFVSRSTRKRHTRQEREVQQWSSTRNSVSFASISSDQGGPEQDNREGEVLSHLVISENESISIPITPPEQHLIANAEFFEALESEEEEEEWEDEGSDENREEWKKEDENWKEQDPGKYFYDSTQMYIANHV